jgi:serine-type D-Ala-D-Ala carboxypeptidase
MPAVLALIAGFALSPLAPIAAVDSNPPWMSRRDDRTALPRISPEDAGMSSERLAEIDGVVNRAIAAGGFPGAAVIVGREGSVVWERGYGALDWGGSRVDPERALYDLASLTKVVATTAAAMVLVDRGRLRLDDAVGRYLPEFRRGAKAEVTVRDLLTHRSGLPAGRDLERAGGPAAARAALLRTPQSRPPETLTA